MVQDRQVRKLHMLKTREETLRVVVPRRELEKDPELMSISGLQKASI